MDNEFGDIDLFNLAIARDRLDPPVDDYLQSVGLSDHEAAEVRALYRTYCQAIENPFTSKLPDLADRPQLQPQANQASAD